MFTGELSAPLLDPVLRLTKLLASPDDIPTLAPLVTREILYRLLKSPDVLILGANGQLARNTTKFLLDRTTAHLTLYLRRSNRLRNPAPDRVTMVDADVLDRTALRAAMHGQDVVYANLVGEMAAQAEAIVDAMNAAGVRRLIFITSTGIYREVPGDTYSRMLDPYRHAAEVIEASNLDYTLLRPGSFTRDEAIEYRLTQKGEQFRVRDVSMNSLSDLIVKLATTPAMGVRCSLGVSRV